MEEVRMPTKFWIEYSEGTKESKELGVDRRLILFDCLPRIGTNGGLI
jgi:hypothetical protein